MRTISTYAGLKRHEKGTVGIIWNREKTEVKKSEGGDKVTAAKRFCKVAAEINP